MNRRTGLLTFIIIITVLFSTGVGAQDLDLHKYVSAFQKEIALITGQVLGSGFYHRAGIHSFGGLDIGVKTMIGLIPEDKRNGPFSGVKIVPIPAFQANIGLFNKFELGGRLFSFKYGNKSKEEVNLSSGVIKYNVIGGLGIPSFTVYSAFSRLAGISDFSIHAVTVGGVFGYGLPLISFYAGGNYNIITMNVTLDADNKFYPNGFSKRYIERIGHATAGISLGIAPFTRINAEYNYGEIKSITVGLIFSIF